MVLQLGYLHSVSTTTQTKPKTLRQATGMERKARDLQRVDIASSSAAALAPKGVDELARTLVAKGDPNIPRSPDAVARAGAKNAARVLTREFGGRWIVDVAA